MTHWNQVGVTFEPALAENRAATAVVPPTLQRTSVEVRSLTGLLLGGVRMKGAMALALGLASTPSTDHVQTRAWAETDVASEAARTPTARTRDIVGEGKKWKEEGRMEEKTAKKAQAA